MVIIRTTQHHGKRITFFTATNLPPLIISMFILSSFGAVSAVQALSFLQICALCICTTTPLVFVGAYVGHRSSVLNISNK